jgi:hypothetical protein
MIRFYEDGKRRDHHVAGLIPTVERRRHKNALPFLAPLAALAIPFVGEAVAPALFGAEGRWRCGGSWRGGR